MIDAGGNNVYYARNHLGVMNMSTVVGRQIPRDPVEINTLQSHYMKGTVIQPAKTNTLAGGTHNPESAGIPFDTQQSVEQVFFEGDAAKGPIKVTRVPAKAMDVVKQMNRVPGGRANENTVSWEKAVELAERPPQPTVAVGYQNPAQPQPLPPPLSGEIVPGPVSPVPPVAPSVAEPTPQQRWAPPADVTLVPKRPKTVVTFAGRFGELAVPYDMVFVDGIALVLVQQSADGIRFKPPMDAEEQILLSWDRNVAWCYSGVHYRLPDGLSAHTVYLIDIDRTEAEINARKVK